MTQHIGPENILDIDHARTYAYQMASQGEYDWIAWTRRDGQTRCARLSAGTIKQAMLDIGTQGAIYWYEAHGSQPLHRQLTWRMANTIRQQKQRGSNIDSPPPDSVGHIEELDTQHIAEVVAALNLGNQTLESSAVQAVRHIFEQMLHEDQTHYLFLRVDGDLDSYFGCGSASGLADTIEEDRSICCGYPISKDQCPHCSE